MKKVNQMCTCLKKKMVGNPSDSIKKYFIDPKRELNVAVAHI